MFPQVALLFALLIYHTPLLAQTQKGAYMIGGDGRVNLPFSGSGSIDINGNLNPRIGYFIGNGLVIGAALPMGYSTSITQKNAVRIYYINKENVSIKRINSLSYGISPFIRYYFNEGKWQPFIQGQLGYSFYHYKTVIEDRENIVQKQNSFSALPGVGLTYFITPSVGLEAMLAYSYNNNSNAQSTISLLFGLQFYLSKKQ